MTKKYNNFILIRRHLFITIIGLLIFLATNASALEIPAYPEFGGQTVITSTELPGFAIYLFNAGMFLGFFIVFLSLIVAGAMYFLSPAAPQLLASAKDRVSGAISGLLILALTYLIITTINPELSVFTLNKLRPIPPIKSTTQKLPGVTFYNSKDCSEKEGSSITTKSKKDLESLKNKVNSVEIAQGGSSYISILYNEINFKGKCLYLDPNKTCNDNLEPWASSASVHQYNFGASGDVYFFRKPCFGDRKNCQDETITTTVTIPAGKATVISGGLGNQTATEVDVPEHDETITTKNENAGGYLKVSANEISGANDKIFIKKLADMQFLDDDGKCSVPEKEQDCIKYNTNGKCADDGRKCPTLGGENVSSIIIDGDYLVVLFYFGPDDKEDGPWTACQEFPTSDDINNTGPQQIKWQFIRNSQGVIPNYVMIIPIKK